MTATNHFTATRKTKTSLRVEDLESRLLMTARYTGQMTANPHGAQWDKARDADLLQVDWEATLFQKLTHGLQLELTLNASEAQSMTVTASESASAPKGFNTFVAPQANATVDHHPVFVGAEPNPNSPAQDSGDGSQSSNSIRPNRRTVKDVLSTRSDAVVAVSLAAYMH